MNENYFIDPGHEWLIVRTKTLIFNLKFFLKIIVYIKGSLLTNVYYMKKLQQ